VKRPRKNEFDHGYVSKKNSLYSFLFEIYKKSCWFYRVLLFLLVLSGSPSSVPSLLEWDMRFGNRICLLFDRVVRSIFKMTKGVGITRYPQTVEGKIFILYITMNMFYLFRYFHRFFVFLPLFLLLGLCFQLSLLYVSVLALIASIYSLTLF
jgi:hypothetical protein